MGFESGYENLVQVGHLGEAYQEWAHQPIVSKEGPRFFQNNVLEVFIMSCMSICLWSIVSSDKLTIQLPVLNKDRMVGCSSYLAASCVLFCEYVCQHGAHNTWSGCNCSDRNTYMDIARVFSAPFPLPYWNKNLLVILFPYKSV